MLVEAEIEQDNTPAPSQVRRPLDSPWPNLRVKEVVKYLVLGIVERCDHCRFTEGEQKVLALGMVCGARITAEQLGSDPLAPYLADLLDRLNQGGIAAVRALVERVTGHELTVAEAA